MGIHGSASRLCGSLANTLIRELGPWEEIDARLLAHRRASARPPLG